MDKIYFLSKFDEIRDKDDRYYLFKGVLKTLDAKEVCQVLDVKLKQDSLKRELLLDKIIGDLNVYLDVRTKSYIVSTNVNLKNRGVYLSVFKKLLKQISKTKDYRINQQYAKFLYRMCPAMPPAWQNKLIRYFISSEYRSNQRRALEHLNRNWDKTYSDDVQRLWMQNYYETALRLIVWQIEDEFLGKEIFDSIVGYFTEMQDDDYFKYDHFAKILRNKFYSRFFERCVSEINDLQTSDPISYIFIQKELGRKIDSEFAIKTYRDNLAARKYLPRWYSEVGMTDVLEKIYKDL